MFKDINELKGTQQSMTPMKGQSRLASSQTPSKRISTAESSPTINNILDRLKAVEDKLQMKDANSMTQQFIRTEVESCVQHALEQRQQQAPSQPAETHPLTSSSLRASSRTFFSPSKQPANDVAGVRREVALLTEDVRQLQRLNIQAEMNTLNEAVKKLSAEVTGLERDKLDQTVIVDFALKTDVAKLDNDFADLQKEVAEHHADCTAALDALSAKTPVQPGSPKPSTDGLDDRVDQVEARVDQLEDRMNAHDAAVAKTTDRVDELFTRQENDAAQCAETASAQTTLNDNVTTLTTDTNQRLDALQKQLEALGAIRRSATTAA